jgi:hypothetical protein
MKRLRIEFMLVNCMKESPTAAEEKTDEMVWLYCSVSV